MFRKVWGKSKSSHALFSGLGRTFWHLKDFFYKIFSLLVLSLPLALCIPCSETPSNHFNTCPVSWGSYWRLGGGDVKLMEILLRLSGDCLNSQSLKPCQSPVMSWTFLQSITPVNVSLSNGVETVVQYFFRLRIWCYSTQIVTFSIQLPFVITFFCKYISVDAIFILCNLIMAANAGNWTIFMDKCFLTFCTAFDYNCFSIKQLLFGKKKHNLQFLNHTDFFVL